MDTKRALQAGVIGAVTLNVVHESARRVIPNAPRVGEVAMRGMQKFVLNPIGFKPSHRNLRLLTLASDLVSNSLYYAAVVGAGRTKNAKAIWQRSALFGLLAGVLTIALPPVFRVRNQPTRNFPVTATLTAVWYLIGALTTATIYNRNQPT